MAARCQCAVRYNLYQQLKSSTFPNFQIPASRADQSWDAIALDEAGILALSLEPDHEAPQVSSNADHTSAVSRLIAMLDQCLHCWLPAHDIH